MDERPRVPMPNRQGASWVGENDIAASVAKMPDYGRHFSMDVAEELLARMGRELLPHVAQKLAERVVHEHTPAIQNTVLDYLNDRAWAAPIIEDEIRKAVQRFTFDLLSDTLATRRDEGGGE